jgi:hypothetical protein
VKVLLKAQGYLLTRPTEEGRVGGRRSGARCWDDNGDGGGDAEKVILQSELGLFMDMHTVFFFALRNFLVF